MASVLNTPQKLVRTQPRPFVWPRRGRTQQHLLTAKTPRQHRCRRLLPRGRGPRSGPHENRGFPRQSGRVAVFSAQHPYQNGIRGRHCCAWRFPHRGRRYERFAVEREVRETLEDCGAVVSRFSDAVVVRHHESGAAARIAAKSLKPVVNAGDGWNEHPTQALVDIFALRRGLGTIRGKSIALAGDPRGRTVRSLAYLLRHEAPREVVFCPPSYYDIPRDVLNALIESQIRCRFVTDVSYALAECDAIMMAPYDMSDIGEACGFRLRLTENITRNSHRHA